MNRVGPFIRARAAPPNVDDPLSLAELKRGLQDSRGSVPGPAQWAAETLLEVPEVALLRPLELCNLIKDTAAWPQALRFQEVVMIPF